MINSPSAIRQSAKADGELKISFSNPIISYSNSSLN